MNTVEERYRDLIERIQHLRIKGKVGSEIAEILCDEGCDIQTARDAFFAEGYVVSIEPFTKDLDGLHVSDQPLEAGLAALVMSSEPRVLPWVIWESES